MDAISRWLAGSVLASLAVSAFAASAEWNELDTKYAVHPSEEFPNILAGMYVPGTSPMQIFPSIVVGDSAACGGPYKGVLSKRAEYINVFSGSGLKRNISVAGQCSGRNLVLSPDKGPGNQFMSSMFYEGRFEVHVDGQIIRFYMINTPNTVAHMIQRQAQSGI